jgi:hypothetical protein
MAKTKEQRNAELRARYKRLKEAGATTGQAKKYRKYEDSAIDQVIELLKKGMGESLPVPDYYKPKGKPKKKKKKDPKKKKTKTGVEYPEAPPGYHYAYYQKTGKFVLRKNREKKEPTIIADPVKTGFPILMIFMKDQTDRVNADDFIAGFGENLEKSRPELIEDMRAEINAPRDSGTIGRTRTVVASSEREREAFLREYSDWALIYAEPPEYKSLLAATATVVSGTYERWRKSSYVQEIIYSAEEINKKVGQKMIGDKIV